MLPSSTVENYLKAIYQGQTSLPRDQRLGRPTPDPHGDPIPTAEGEITARHLDSLLTCPLGTPLKVTRISDQDPAFLRFIESNDLKPGEPVEVESRDDVADSVMLKQ